MEAVIGFLLQVLAFGFLVSAGGIVISFFIDVVISLFDEHEGVFVNRGKGTSESSDAKKSNVVSDGDKIVVYKDLPVPDKKAQEAEKEAEIVNGEKVTSVDFDKAAEEQRMLMSKGAPAPNFDSKPQFDQPEPSRNVFMDDEDEDDDEYAAILDEVVAETKRQMKGGKSKKKVVVEDDDEDDVKEEKVVAEEPKPAPAPATPQKRKVIYKERKVDDADKAAREKELQELKEIKEQQVKELEEFRKLKEEFAKEKEDQLKVIKLDETSESQEEIDRLRAELEAERSEIQRLRDSLNKEPEHKEPETIIEERIIKDDEEIKRIKLNNLVRMNARLTRILKSVDKVEEDKKKRLARLEEQKRKLEEKKKYEEQLRAQKQYQLELAQREYETKKAQKQKEEEQKQEEREAQKRKQEELRSIELAKKEELRKRLLEPLDKKPSKYNLNTGAKKSTNSNVSNTTSSSEEVYTETIVTEEVEEVNTGVQTKSKSVVRPNRATNDVVEVIVEDQKPLNPRDYYENRLLDLAEEMKEAEKELRVNKREYIPLTRIHKAFARDSEKLRKKEIIVAKQKVALYGVNASKVDPAKKEKLDENLRQLAELKDSVEHCQEIITKNKDRYPILEKNNVLINKHIAKIQYDIDNCNKAIEYYDKHKK